jgi:hypothetical protein
MTDQLMNSIAGASHTGLLHLRLEYAPDDQRALAISETPGTNA